MNNDIRAYFEELRQESSHCQHENVILIPEYQEMTCQDCGCVVNPFEFVMQHHGDFTNIVTSEVRL